MAKIGLYIDGFNMYHALKALGKPHLKWLDLWAVAQTFCTKDDEVSRVVYCSATRTDDQSKMPKHRAYIKALRARGVECLLGHFVDQDAECYNCRSTWMQPTEKQGDVALALAVIDDAHRGLIERAYLLTADSDQLATIKLFRERFPELQIVSVAPPGKYHHGKLRDAASSFGKLDVVTLELCLLPKLAGSQEAPILRPADYDPP